MSTIEEEDELPQKRRDVRHLARFLSYLRPHRGVVSLLGAIILLNIAVDLTGPFLIRAAIDGPVAAKDPAGLIKIAAVFFVVIALLSGLVETALHYVSNLAGQRILYDLRVQVFDHLQKLPLSYFDATPVGRLLTRVTGDVENLAELFTSGLVGMLSNVLYLVLLIAAMLILDWRLTALTMSVLPFALAGTWLFRKHASATYSAARRSIAAVTSFLNESLTGIKTIQSFNRQAFCADRFSEGSRRFRDNSVKAGFVYSFFWPGIEFLTSLAVALILWRGGEGILAGTTSFGSFIAFWTLARKFFEPLQELAEKYNILQAAMASSERIFAILDSPEAPAPEHPAPPPPALGSVSFENVSFSYDGKTPVLKDVSFLVSPGESVALVGYTGAGKTSVLSLLLGFYRPQAGRILVDGVDVKDWDPRVLRGRFGMVFQDAFLFSDSALANVGLGRNLAPETLDAAAKLVNADRVLSRLPAGWQTPLHERGSSVSVGERQLISFARALAADPPILILDEATANIDSQTEGMIQDGLKRAMKGRSSLIVAHRLSTIRSADSILVFHRGELRERGTHEELLALDGIYARLHRLQRRNDS